MKRDNLLKNLNISHRVINFDFFRVPPRILFCSFYNPFFKAFAASIILRLYSLFSSSFILSSFFAHISQGHLSVHHYQARLLNILLSIVLNHCPVRVFYKTLGGYPISILSLLTNVLIFSLWYSWWAIMIPRSALVRYSIFFTIGP